MVLSELVEELRKMDEITLLETLEIESWQLVDKFYDEIDERQDELIKKFNDEL